MLLLLIVLFIFVFAIDVTKFPSPVGGLHREHAKFLTPSSVFKTLTFSISSSWRAFLKAFHVCLFLSRACTRVQEELRNETMGLTLMECANLALSSTVPIFVDSDTCSIKEEIMWISSFTVKKKRQIERRVDGRISKAAGGTRSYPRFAFRNKRSWPLALCFRARALCHYRSSPCHTLPCELCQQLQR